MGGGYKGGERITPRGSSSMHSRLLTESDKVSGLGYVERSQS